MSRKGVYVCGSPLIDGFSIARIKINPRYLQFEQCHLYVKMYVYVHMCTRWNQKVHYRCICVYMGRCVCVYMMKSESACADVCIYMD